MSQLKKIQRILMIAFLSPITICLVLVLLYEADVLEIGIWAGRAQSEFIALVVMELWTVCTIPLSLRLFKFKRVKRELRLDGEVSGRALLKWGSCRLMMIGVPLVINVLLYYLLMKVTFFYLAVILFLSMFFVVPTLERCVSEAQREVQKEHI